jgi:hypothetical protein
MTPWPARCQPPGRNSCPACLTDTDYHLTSMAQDASRPCIGQFWNRRQRASAARIRRGGINVLPGAAGQAALVSICRTVHPAEPLISIRRGFIASGISRTSSIVANHDCFACKSRDLVHHPGDSNGWISRLPVGQADSGDRRLVLIAAIALALFAHPAEPFRGRWRFSGTRCVWYPRIKPA